MSHWQEKEESESASCMQKHESRLQKYESCLQKHEITCMKHFSDFESV